MLPFGGRVVHMKLLGKELQQLLDVGMYQNVGIGGYIQTAGITKEGQCYYIAGEQLDYEKFYEVAMPEFLAQGKEQNLEFLDKKRYAYVDEFEGVNNDVRDIFIAFLKSQRN